MWLRSYWRSGPPGAGRWNTTSPFPADLIPLLCTHCGLSLAGGDEAALFVCPGCGQVHEVGDAGLDSFAAATAAVTTELAVSGPTRYLAVWRLLPDARLVDDPVWEHIRRAAAPGPAYLYVPAFSMMRSWSRGSG